MIPLHSLDPRKIPRSQSSSSDMSTQIARSRRTKLCEKVGADDADATPFPEHTGGCFRDAVPRAIAQTQADRPSIVVPDTETPPLNHCALRRVDELLGLHSTGEESVSAPGTRVGPGEGRQQG